METKVLFKNIFKSLSYTSKSKPEAISDISLPVTPTKMVTYWSTDMECWVNAKVPKYINIISTKY